MKISSVVILLIFLIAAGCDGNSRILETECTTSDDLANSECLAEDVAMLCEDLLCGSELNGLAVDFLVPGSFDCVVVDCESLECGEPRSYKELGLSENGHLIGIAITSVQEELDFLCPGG